MEDLSPVAHFEIIRSGQRYPNLDAAGQDDGASGQELSISLLIHFVRSPVPIGGKDGSQPSVTLKRDALVQRCAGRKSEPDENMALVAFRRTKASPSTETTVDLRFKPGE